VLRALHAAAAQFPRTLTWSVRLGTEPPPAEAMAGGLVTLHPATPFWRLGTRLTEQARVDVAGSGTLAPTRDLLAAWVGRPVTLRRTAPGAAHRPVSAFGVP
jgi:nucleotidyltransferase/DNA polymerase involved in DNA repair